MGYFQLDSNFIEHILLILGALQKNLLPTLFDLLIGIILIRISVRLLRRILKLTKIQTGLRYVITSIAEILGWIFLTAILLQEIGLSGVIYFFTGSIAAIGIAMAAGGSTLISDIVAAVFLAQDKDFNVGDEVKVGWDPVTEGIVERMDARRIRIRDKNGILHVIPNSVVERREWVVVRRRSQILAETKAALEKKTKANEKTASPRKNA